MNIKPILKVYHRKPKNIPIYDYTTGEELPFSDYKYKKIYDNVAFRNGDIFSLGLITSRNLSILKEISPEFYKKIFDVYGEKVEE